MDLRIAAVLLAACSSSGKPVEDAKRPSPPSPPPSAGSDAAASAADAPAPRPAATTGDVSVRVEWPGVTAEVRASPGSTPCGTPRAPQAAPTTTFGIPDAVVFVDGAPAAPAEARVRLADCALAPKVAIGSTLIVDSAADRPAKLVLSHRAQADDPRGKLEESTPPRTIQLPIAGHAVTAPLDAGSIYALATDAKDPELAWIVAATASLTDASGVALVKDVSPGVHAVRAWLPPRAGRPARVASGKVTVEAGELAELTLKLEP
ncbi:MAG: hypothetical protein JNL83_40475 [Myxococcales bacterium]|nr:hypothetical protein [Myxococcales bacterium]